MSTGSNRYAEFAFSEHPLALWTLDDSIFFENLLSPQQLDSENWVGSGFVSSGTVEESSPIPGSPVESLDISSSFEIVLPQIQQSVVAGLDTVCLSFYAQKRFSGLETLYLQVRRGTEYQVVEFKNIPLGNWAFFQATFDVPDGSFFVAIAGDTSDSGEVFISGMSLAEGSEHFAPKSTGNVFALSSELDISSVPDRHSKVFPYGISSSNAAVFVEQGRLLGKQFGLPLVFGTESSMRIFPSVSGAPSLIVPGLGMMNVMGGGTDYTLEFWARISPSRSTNRRIVGPVGSFDGIYIEGPFIEIRFGRKTASHYVGEWARPMLISLVVANNSASLIINGESVATIASLEVTLPEQRDENGKSLDWIAFYSYPEIEEFSLECVAIYPYIVSPVISKRRFVFGQAVDPLQSTVSEFSGIPVAFDPTSAKYSNTFAYPRTGDWSQGVFENINAGTDRLSSPSPSLPGFEFEEDSEDVWVQDLAERSTRSGPAITLRPDTSWNATSARILFDSIDPSSISSRSIYGVFEADQNQQSTSTLLRFVDESSRYFSIDLDDKEIVYRFSGRDGVEQDIYRVMSEDGSEPAKIGLGEIFAVGIDMESFVKTFGNELVSFFSNRAGLSLYVGGTENFDKTFGGQIHRVGFCSARNFSKARQFFSSNGTVPIEEAIYDGGEQSILEPQNPIFSSDDLDGGFAGTVFAPSIFEHIATYTLFNSRQGLDVATDSYWQDYVPLSRLSKNVELSDGSVARRVSYIQFNVDYPRSKDVRNGVVDTNLERVKTYVSFQFVKDGANKRFSQLPNIVPPSSSGFVVPEENWIVSKYEVLDGDIIVPPAGVNQELLAIVVHVDMLSTSSTRKSVSIRQISLSAKTLSQIEPSTIGTKFGKNLFPYKRFGIYSVYGQVVPSSLQTQTSPYLYLDSTSGIRLLGNSSPDSGVSIPVNEEGSDDNRVSSISFWINRDREPFDQGSENLIEIRSNEYILVLVANSSSNGERAELGLVDQRTGQNVSNVLFFIDGTPTTNPYISTNSWVAVSIAFPGGLDFSLARGGIRLVGRNTLISQAVYFAKNQKELLQSDFLSEEVWQESKAIAGQPFVGTDPAKIFRNSLGIERFVVGNGAGVFFGKNQYAIYKDIRSSTISVIPV
jgi:hypothetical protein